eukprot:jgi/Bigna1/143712/aug1.80_g18420
MEGTLSKGSWECAACIYKNTFENNMCVICAMPRPEEDSWSSNEGQTGGNDADSNDCDIKLHRTIQPNFSGKKLKAPEIVQNDKEYSVEDPRESNEISLLKLSGANPYRLCEKKNKNLQNGYAAYQSCQRESHASQSNTVKEGRKRERNKKRHKKIAKHEKQPLHPKRETSEVSSNKKNLLRRENLPIRRQCCSSQSFCTASGEEISVSENSLIFARNTLYGGFRERFKPTWRLKNSKHLRERIGIEGRHPPKPDSFIDVSHHKKPCQSKNELALFKEHKSRKELPLKFDKDKVASLLQKECVTGKRKEMAIPKKIMRATKVGKFDSNKSNAGFKMQWSSDTCLFSSARGKPMHIKPSSLDKARNLLFGEKDTAVPVKQRATNASLFSSAGGKPMHIKPSSLDKARNLLFGEKDTAVPVKQRATNASLFSSAGGKPMHIKPSSLDKARNLLFGEKDTAVPVKQRATNASLFSSAGGKPMHIKPSSLDKARNLLFGEKDTAVPVKQRATNASLFSSAGGKPMHIKPSSLDKARNLLFDEKDTAVISGVETSSLKDSSRRDSSHLGKIPGVGGDWENKKQLSGSKSSLQKRFFSRNSESSSSKSLIVLRGHINRPTTFRPGKSRKATFKAPRRLEISKANAQTGDPNFRQINGNPKTESIDYRHRGIGLKKKRLRDIFGDCLQKISAEALPGVEAKALSVTSLNALSHSFVEGNAVLGLQDAIKHFSDMNPACSTKWVENHYRWIVWKLASYDRRIPTTKGNTFFNFANVLGQLRKRYQREVLEAERPAIKKILEGDASAAGHMVLCVASIPESGNDIELTDGWYSLKAQLDNELKILLRKGKIFVGLKLHICGGQLSGGSGPTSPLENMAARLRM